MWGRGHHKQYEKYLGLPPIIGRSKKKAFAEIKAKVWKKLQLWKEGLLSQGGWETLIKSAALPILTYAVSYFKFSTSLCAEIESLMVKFWWGQRKNENKIHWIS